MLTFLKKHFIYAAPHVKINDTFISNNLTFYITGYPGIRSTYTMWGKISFYGDDQKMVKYDIDTEPGQSGSGIWFKNMGRIYCIGVHAYSGNDNENFKLGILTNNDIINAFKRFNLKSTSTFDQSWTPKDEMDANKLTIWMANDSTQDQIDGFVA